MALYIRTTKKIIGYFIIALILVSFPLALFLDKLHITNFNYRWLYLLAIGFVLLLFVLTNILKKIYFYYYKYPKISEYYDELNNNSFEMAQQKYPSKEYLKNNQSKWKEAVKKQLEYHGKLISEAKAKTIDKFNLNELEWNWFQIKYMRNKKHNENSN